MKKNSVIIVYFLSLGLVVGGCGSSTTATDAATSASTLSTTMAAMAVTSPTAARSSTTAQLKLEKLGKLASLYYHIKGLFISPSMAAAAPDTEVQPLTDMVTSLKSDVTSATPSAIAAKIGNMSAKSYSANCYGPSWTDNATGSSVNRPSGDLGMVAAQASTTDTTACAAAQLNSLIGGSPQFANKLIKLQATLVSSMKTAGLALPAVGASVDVLSSMPTITGLTMTAAKLARLKDRSDGLAVYKTTFAFTDSNSKKATVTIYHTPKNSDNSNFTGLIQAILPHSANGGTGTKRGFSMVYDQTDSVLTYALDTAANRETDSDDFFSTTTGRVDFSKTAFGEDGNRIIASFNTKTNAVTMHYAWQAGSNDNAVRAFALDIPAGTEGALTGVAYFGFGAKISSLTDTVTTPWMTKMHCNWLNGLANGSSVAKVQGQTFKQSGTKFIPVTSNINFAPTDTCNGSTYTVTNSSPTGYDSSSRSGTIDLVAVNALGTIPGVTVPTYTIPTE